MSKRVKWNARSKTFLDVIQARRAELGLHVLALVAQVTRHTVWHGNVVPLVRTTTSHVYTQMYSTHAVEVVVGLVVVVVVIVVVDSVSFSLTLCA